MTLNTFARWTPAVGLVFALAGCGGGGGGGGSSAGVPAPSPQGPEPVTITGTVTYDFVPVSLFGGLDYSQTEARPARLVTVQFIGAGGVLATAKTDRNGDYSLDVDPSETGFLRVRAEMTQEGTLPGWFYQIVDNTSSNAIYTLDGAEFSTGTADSEHDLHAPSGWTGSEYGAERAAAPFAILDTILIGTDFVLGVDPEALFPTLDIYWSPSNVPSLDADGNRNFLTGEIGSSQFVSICAVGGSCQIALLLLGAEDLDTEEYDRHVILHEFGHYLVRTFGRSDSIGGPHSLVDLLDMRVAYSEGLATAFAAIALGDPNYRDTTGSGQGSGFGFSVESFPQFAPGWYSEQSVQELVYDLVDADMDPGHDDTLNYPFSTVWAALTESTVATPGLTSIFPLLNALRSANPGDVPAIDAMAAAQAISSIDSDFGDTETNDAGSPDVLPVYHTVNIDDTVEVCSTDEFTSTFSGAVNKLASRQFVRFTPFAEGDVTITVTTTSVPPPESGEPGNFADPDFAVYRNGLQFGFSNGPPSDACRNTEDAAWQPDLCEEAADPFFATPVEHVIDVYEWSNTNDVDDPEFPPIGRTCFNVTVTQP